MEKLKPSEKLDVVLRYIKGIKDPYIVSFKTVLSDFSKTHPEFTNKELWTILVKLQKDGFIDDDASHKGSYFITFDGETILELEDGYTGRLKNHAKIKSKEKNRAIWLALVSGTLGILVGGILTIVQGWFQKSNEPLKFDLPKIQIVHDTMYQTNQSHAQKDTSLVRIVKLKGKR